MNNMIRRMRAAASLLSDEDRKALERDINALEQSILALSRSDTPDEAEENLKQLNGLWARLKKSHEAINGRSLLKRPLLTLGRK